MSHRVQQRLALDQAQRLLQRDAVKDGAPFARVPVIGDVEQTRRYPLDAGERRVEFRDDRVRAVGPEALDEAVAAAVPSTTDVDGIVPLGRDDPGQEARLQNLANETLAGEDDRL